MISFVEVEKPSKIILNLRVNFIKRMEFLFNKMAKIIQRYVRGFIVRVTILRLHKAAYFIQGYFRMRWLSFLFQRLRHSARIIQVILNIEPLLNILSSILSREWP